MEVTDSYTPREAGALRVTLLLSDKSTGSTIFQHEICKHPEINHVAYSMHNVYETLHWVKGACILCMPGQDFGEGKVYFPAEIARRYTIKLIKGNVPEFMVPSNDEALIFEGWNALCERFSPVFFEKSPHHLNHWAALTLILRYIESTDHDVRVIGLVRNPLAVTYSLWKRWRLTHSEERQFLWARSYRNLLSFKEMLPPERFHLVRYEDMVSRPKETMRLVCQFLGLNYCSDIGAGFHTCSLKKWYSDPEFTLQLDGSVALLARHFGYTKEDLFNPPKPEAPRVQRIRMRVLQKYRRVRSKILGRFIRPYIRDKLWLH